MIRPFQSVLARLWSIALIVIGLLCVVVDETHADNVEQAEEYRAKTALIYSFAKFVTWPDAAFASDESSFIFGIMGGNPFGEALALLEDKRIHGRPIRIVEFDGPENFAPCQMLFCNIDCLNRFTEDYPQLLDSLNVLSVSEDEGFASQGGVLSLVLVDDHLGFEINATAARNAQLELSSSLFKLAQSIFE
jgi:hypothetical protein